MLLDWIDETKLDYEGLSQNCHDGAMALLRKNQDKIPWNYLSENSNDGAI
jgi:hypothetical protein